MTISDAVRARVRKRADYACEFCGVREVDSGGELTMDHYQPKFKGGNDDLDNLLYCCQRCNQYKLDYWPVRAGDLPLWNPRQNNASKHFIELDDGKLYPLTSIGTFTINRLRLNRPPFNSTSYSGTSTCRRRASFGAPAGGCPFAGEPQSSIFRAC